MSLARDGWRRTGVVLTILGLALLAVLAGWEWLRGNRFESALAAALCIFLVGVVVRLRGALQQ
ncbi:MAG TPA: hypothetical protein VNB28_08250, partial [Methylomirabilota bacterium]|nr:hypothetical protein [Methylomirabilota bacterium]